MAVSFDGITKRMEVTSVSTVDVQRDLYSAWKHWLVLSDNAKYEQAMRPVGGDSIGGGQSSPAYFFLMNDWKVVVDGITVNFVLNLYCEEATNSTYFPFVVLNNGAVSYKVSDSPIVSTSEGLSGNDRTLLETAANNDAEAVWDNQDAKKLLNENLHKAVISSDGQHVTVYEEDGVTISHEFDISADKRTRTPV